MQTIRSNWFKVLSMMVVAVLVTGSALLAIPSQAVYAQTGTPPVDAAQNPNQGQWRVHFLERAYKTLMRLKDHVVTDFDRTAGIVERTNGLVEKLEAAGMDPAPIPTALTDFEAAIAASQSTLDEALNILTNHAGFDDQGKVTDKEQAAQTIQSARDQLKTAHQTFHTALKQLRDVLQQYRTDHPFTIEIKPGED